jgi:hypothetical protein
MAPEEPTEVSIREIEQALKRGIGAADPERASGLANLLRLTEARESGLRREYERLSKVLSPNDPRLDRLVLRLEAGEALRQEAGFEVSRSKAGVPAPEEGAWTLHGFVRGADEGGLDDKSVALYDARGARINESEAPIEADGRFLVRIPVPDTEQEKRPIREVFAHVIDARGRAIYRDPRGLRPEKGHISYLKIDLQAGTPSRPAPGRAPRERQPDPPGRRRAASADAPASTERARPAGRRRSRRSSPPEEGQPR